jgi:Domain of unknown function (DUF6457)
MATSEGSETGAAWAGRYAAAAGIEPPDGATIEAILKLASVAAHSSERLAAPIACWIAGSAGLDLDRALALAEDLGEPG